jgi:queuosine precursor transporter
MENDMIYVGMYLAAIVAANLLAARFGPAVTVLNAFLFIGLDLTARDSLHEAWNGRGLWWKMGILIATGSALSFALNRDAGPIALASFVAFASAGMIDALVYHRLLHLPRWLRINGSNVPSAFTDSLVFPTLAFGGFLWPIVLGQFAAKVLGGFVWSLAFRAFDKRQAAFVN